MPLRILIGRAVVNSWDSLLVSYIWFAVVRAQIPAAMVVRVRQLFFSLFCVVLGF